MVCISNDNDIYHFFESISKRTLLEQILTIMESA